MIDKHVSIPSPDNVDTQRRELESITARILQLCESDLDAEQFYPEFLRHASAAIGANAGAIWLCADADDADPAYELNLAEALPTRDSERWIGHRNLVAEVCDRGEPTLVMPRSQAHDDFRQDNPTEMRLLLAPLRDGERLVGAVEMLQPQTAVTDTHCPYLRYLVSICEAASRWLQARALREMQQTLPIWRRQQEFCRIVHESLETEATAFAIANEARRLIECDRVSVALCRGSRCRIAAVSGQDVIDRRSNVVRRLCKLAETVVAAGDELWHVDSAEGLCPQVESALNDYVEESMTKSVVVLPLQAPCRDSRTASAEEEDRFEPGRVSGRIIGALLIERVHGVLSRADVQPCIDVIWAPSGLALSNALEHSGLFLMPLWRTLGKAGRLFQGRTLAKTLAALLLIATAVLALVMVPGELTLPAQGTLEPLRTQHVYAAQAGVVRRVNVESGDWVEVGQTLAELDNPELRGEYERVLGDRHTTAEQLRTVRIKRLRAPGLSAADRVSLAGERERLAARLRSLDEELALLRSQLASLRVESPISGQVATWDVEQLLRDRPVKTGQILLTLFDPSEGWQLELNVADRRVGHLTGALKQQRQAIEVSYVFATDPGTVRSGLVHQVQPVAELHESEGQSVRVQVLVSPGPGEKPLTGLKPGTTVMGELHCGQRSLGYVWLHESFEAVQRFWFRLL